VRPAEPNAVSIVVKRRLAELLDREVRELHRVSGGDVAEAFCVELEGGDRIFAKTHARPPNHFFSTEATGLAWLRSAVAESSAGIRVPEVIMVSNDFLVLEWIEHGTRGSPAEAEFGRSLARIHRLRAPCFGRQDRRTTGSRALPNEPFEAWSDFYRTNRLAPLGRRAADIGALSGSTIRRLDAVAERLDEFGAADEPPALLHGDLWAGNRLVDVVGVNWLIDPAAHGGHREFDLAMMALFGGFADDCWSAYHDEYPLGDGWRERIPLHQLAPLVVHAIKFGGGYRAAVEQAHGSCEGRPAPRGGRLRP